MKTMFRKCLKSRGIQKFDLETKITLKHLILLFGQAGGDILSDVMGLFLSSANSVYLIIELDSPCIRSTLKKWEIFKGQDFTVTM